MKASVKWLHSVFCCDDYTRFCIEASPLDWYRLGQLSHQVEVGLVSPCGCDVCRQTQIVISYMDVHQPHRAQLTSWLEFQYRASDSSEP